MENEVVNKIFSSDLQKRLFPKNSFVSQSKLDSGIAFEANTIEIPQSELDLEVGKNPDTYPLPVKKKSNGKKTYDADLYFTNPFHIPNHEAAVLSYDKRSALLEEKAAALRTAYADDCAYNWCPTKAESIIRTTGEAEETKLAGATGNRKKMTLKDFVEADRILNAQDVPQEGRVCLLPANMYAQIVNEGIKGFIGSDKLSSELIAKGAVGQILGFTIFTRSRTAFYNNASIPQKQAFNAEIQEATNEAALFWHPSKVRRAEGTVKVFSENDKPMYLGSVANAAFRGGSTIGRKDQKGVVALVQAHGDAS